MTEMYEAPSQLVQLIDRNELVQRLDHGRCRRLTLIQAPAGFGKTTLLSQWQDYLKLKNIAVTWVTFTEDTWTVDNFLETMGNALKASGLPIDRPDDIFPKKTGQWQLTQETILRALELSVLPRVIMLDEYDHCSNEDINGIVTHLLNRLPPFIHIAITSRYRPMLSIARHYAAGQVTLIGPQDLRLSMEDARVLFDSMITPEMTERVYEVSEGWAVVLQLVRLWLEAGGEPTTVLEALTDQHEEVTRFLAEQVLSALTPEERDFLVDTSFLDRFPPALCDFVRQTEGSLTFLEGMNRLYPLVRYMSADTSTIRVHPLLRAQARHLLSCKGEKAVCALQRRAAIWFAQSGEPYWAMHHAIKAGDPDLAADFFEQAGGVLLVSNGGPSLLNRMLSLLPATIHKTRPRVQLAQATMLSATGKIEEGRDVFKQLQENTADFSLAACRNMRDEIIITRFFFLVFSDEMASDTLLKNLQDDIINAKQADPRARSLLPSYLSLSLLQRGELTAARKAIDAAMAALDDAENPYQSSYPIIYDGIHDQIRGNLTATVEKCDQAISLTESKLGNPGNLAILTALSVKIEALVDLGRFNEANAALYIAQTEFADVTGWFEVYAPQLRASCELSYLTGGYDAVITVIERFKKSCNAFHSQRLSNLMLIYKAKAAARADKKGQMDIESLSKLWTSCSGVSTTVTWRELDGVGFAYSRTLIALGQFSQALQVVDDLELIAARHDWRKTLVECYFMRAVICSSQGNQRQATESMKESLILAMAHDIQSPFLMETDLSTHLLSLTVDDLDMRDPVGQFAARLLQARKEIGTPLKLPFLSPREHLVLAEVCRGYANKVIARNLGLSENTVKTHLKSIFRKAEIRSRAEAVDLGRRYFIGTSN